MLSTSLIMSQKVMIFAPVNHSWRNITISHCRQQSSNIQAVVSLLSCLLQHSCGLVGSPQACLVRYFGGLVLRVKCDT